MSAAWLLAWVLLGPPPPRVDTGVRESPANIMQQLSRRADGGYEHSNRRAGFSATIHPNGKVTFRDHAIGGGSVNLFGFDLTGRTPNVPDASQPSNTLVRPQDLGSLGDDPLVKNGPYGPPPIMLRAGGRMAGIADLAQASRRAGAKQRFLDQTEALRGKLAADHRRASERAALASIESDLTTLWSDGDTPASIRREKIFQRWDDAVELPADGEASSEQRARGRAGDRARRRIAAWIREHLPKSGRDGFTAAELRDMNERRRSRAVFEPYVVPETPLPDDVPVGPQPTAPK
jgi:type II secretory pathway pseudopilin PulG